MVRHKCHKVNCGAQCLIEWWGQQVQSDNGRTDVHKQIFAKQVYLQSGGQLNKNLTKIICSFYIFFTKFWFIPKDLLSKQAQLDICGKPLKTPRETPEDNCSTVSMNTGNI